MTKATTATTEKDNGAIDVMKIKELDDDQSSITFDILVGDKNKSVTVTEPFVATLTAAQKIADDADREIFLIVSASQLPEDEVRNLRSRQYKKLQKALSLFL